MASSTLAAFEQQQFSASGVKRKNPAVMHYPVSMPSFQLIKYKEFFCSLEEKISRVGDKFLDPKRMREHLKNLIQQSESNQASLTKEIFDQQLEQLNAGLTAFRSNNWTMPEYGDLLCIRNVLAMREEVGDEKRGSKFQQVSVVSGDSTVTGSSLFCAYSRHLYLYTLGSYGAEKEKDILSIIYKITNNNSDVELAKEAEQELATFMLKEFTGTGHIIKKDFFDFLIRHHSTLITEILDEISRKKIVKTELAKIGVNWKKACNSLKKNLALKHSKILERYYKKYKAICFLTLLEVFRRPAYANSDNTSKVVKDRGKKSLLSQPFILFNWIVGLSLIAKGHLRMKDMFDAEAPYNISAGKNLRHKKSEYFQTRIENLYVLYVEKEFPLLWDKAKENLDSVSLLPHEIPVLDSISIYKLLNQALPHGAIPLSPQKPEYYATPPRRKRNNISYSARDYSFSEKNICDKENTHSSVVLNKAEKPQPPSSVLFSSKVVTNKPGNQGVVSRVEPTIHCPSPMLCF